MGHLITATFVKGAGSIAVFKTFSLLWRAQQDSLLRLYLHSNIGVYKTQAQDLRLRLETEIIRNR